MSSEAMPPYLVVSTGRCGSTLITEMMAAHPDVLSLSELFSSLVPGAFPQSTMDGPGFWALLDRLRPQWSLLVAHGLEPSEVVFDFDTPSRFRRDTGVPPLCLIALPSLTSQVDDLYDEIRSVVETFPRATVAGHYSRFLDWLCARFGRVRWVERSGGSLAWTRELVETFPDARFVHLYRNGLDTSASMSRHSVFRLARACERIEGWLGVDPFASDDRSRVDRVPDAWRCVLPEQFDPRGFVDLDIPFEEFVATWTTMIVWGLDALAEVDPDRVLHLRYEQLVEDPRTEVARLASFMELDLDNERGRRWYEHAVGLVRPAGPRVAVDLNGRSRVAYRIGERRLVAASLDR